MFAKPAQFKPFAAIKNSERKNVLGRIEKQCGLEETTPEEKQLLLPKTVQTANALSHGGDKISVYAEDQLPLWIVYKSQLVPTVALVARLPEELQLRLLPTVYTVPRTLQYLQNGADFMTPGIFGDLPTDPVKKGTPVQIRDLDSQTVMATGLALRDLSTITEDDTGKCIQTFSVVGDKLTPNTKLGSSKYRSEQKAPTSAAATAATTPTAAVNGTEAAESESETKESSPETKKSEQPNTVVEPSTPAVGELGLEGTDDEEEEEENLSPKEVDEAFMYAVNKVIRQPKHTYPMTMAGFSTYLQEALPYEHSQLNIKNTTFKKMGKLLKHAEKMGLITCRDRQGGEIVVTGVNVPQNEMEPEQPVRKSKKKVESGSRMSAFVLYKPKPSVRHIMNPEIADKELHDAGTLRKSVLNYVSEHKLLNENQEINIDEALRKALGLRQTVATIKREEVGALVVKQCTTYHKIVAPGTNPDQVSWSKGPVPTIVTKTERRGGNKVVTLVQTAGLLGFKIDPDELADELRHACAGSATVTDVKGTKSIVVQGNHVAKIVKVLEKRGVKPAWVNAS